MPRTHGMDRIIDQVRRRRCLLRATVPCIAFVVAAGAATFLATHMALTGDEFHTISHLDHGSLGDLWRAYRSTRDTLPPTGYVFSWMVAKLIGTGTIATRLPMVLCWGVAAAVIAVVLERSGRRAALAGAVLPTASAMVFLGAFARPYALVFCALAVAALAWQRSFRTRAPLAWFALLAIALGAATALHYATGAVVVAFGVAEAVSPRSARRRWAVLCALGASLLPLLASVPLMPRAIEDQARIPGETGLDQVVRFYVSVSRPMWPMLVVAACLSVVSWWLGRADRGNDVKSSQRRRDRLHPSSWFHPARVRPEVRLGASLAVVVPILVVVGMGLTSGVYLHRYAVGALLGASLLAGAGVGSLAARSRRWARVAGVLTALILMSVPVAVRQVSHDHLGASDARAMARRLELTGGEARIVVLDSYTFQVLRRYSDPEVRARLVLGVPATFAGTESDVIDWRSLLPMGPDATPLHLVGPRQMEELPDLLADGWQTAIVAEESHVVAQRERQLVHVVVDAPTS